MIQDPSLLRFRVHRQSIHEEGMRLSLPLPSISIKECRPKLLIYSPPTVFMPLCTCGCLAEVTQPYENQPSKGQRKEPGIVKDVFDGSHYRTLLNTFVPIDSSMPFYFFSDRQTFLLHEEILHTCRDSPRSEETLGLGSLLLAARSRTYSTSLLSRSPTPIPAADCFAYSSLLTEWLNFRCAVRKGSFNLKLKNLKF
jgi:hypothetical protein